MKKEQLVILESLSQFPNNKDRTELKIGKNDPKNGSADYWWAAYGEIHLSGYYSLPALLADLADSCLKMGYIDLPENALLIEKENDSQ